MVAHLTSQPYDRAANAHRQREPDADANQAGLWLRDGDAIIGYHLEVLVTDMLIRDVPDDVVAAVDARASRLGLSRSEYVRRRLAQDAAGPARW